MLGGGVLGSRVLIMHFDERQLTGVGSNISYDLRVGPKYRDHREEHPWDLEPNGEITLLPGAAVIIQTEEEVHFPQSMVGYVVPKVGTLQKGLSNTMSKVDPGYHGPLVITLFNLGKQDVTVKRSETFCALVIHQTLDGATLYDGVGKQVAGQSKAGFMFRFQRLRDRLEAHPATISAVLIIATVTLSIVTLIDVSLHLPSIGHVWHSIRGK